MGRQSIFLPEQKTSYSGDLEREPLPINDKARWGRSQDSPSQKDGSFVRALVKWILISVAVVLGMTFIPEALSTTSWSIDRMLGYGNYDGHYGAESTCPATSTTNSTTVSFGFGHPGRFSLNQLSHSPTPHRGLHDFPVRTVGEINVRPTEQRNPESQIQVDLHIRSSSAELTKPGIFIVGSDDHSLTIKTPQFMPQNLVTQSPPCLHITATIWTSPDTDLESLDINSETLNVIFYPSLDYARSRSRDIGKRPSANHLEIDNSLWKSTYSRETIINVNSGSVSGAYPLYDLLSIHTDSGSISITVNPKDALKDNIKPAALRLTSNSGSVLAAVSTASVPERDYQSHIYTSSGSIDATILHGLRTSLRSLNGRISAYLYPYGHNNSRTDIETHCLSGSTSVTVYPSISHPTAPLDKFYAYYSGTSGSIDLFYPAQWEGTVEGTTLSGGIDLDWQGLRVVSDEKEGYVKRKIVAVRGEGEGKLTFYDASGHVKLSGQSGGRVKDS